MLEYAGIAAGWEAAEGAPDRSGLRLDRSPLEQCGAKLWGPVLISYGPVRNGFVRKTLDRPSWPYLSVVSRFLGYERIIVRVVHYL